MKLNEGRSLPLRAFKGLQGQQDSRAGPFYLQHGGKEVQGMEEAISRREHEEFVKRIEDENHRQNRRIDNLEETTRQIGDLTTSVQKLALSLESMVKEQEQQGQRLQVLESRDGEMWRKVVGHLITVVIGIVVGYIFTRIGM